MNPKDEYVKLARGVIFAWTNECDSEDDYHALGNAIVAAIQIAVEQDRKMRFEIDWPNAVLFAELNSLDYEQARLPNRMYNWLKSQTKLVEIKDKGDV